MLTMRIPFRGRGYCVEAETTHRKIRPASRLLVRGESSVAFVGLALAAILIAAFAGGVWWLLRQERFDSQAKATQQVQSAGDLMAGSIETLLGAGEVSTVRRLVSDAARRHGFTRCRVVLPDGQILADADARQITLQKLPATWASSNLDAVAINTAPDAVTAAWPLHVEARGTAKLEVRAAVEQPNWLQSQAQVGLAAIGALALAAGWFVYRTTRNRIRTLGAIRESLMAWRQNSGDDANLALSPAFGREADAWNELLADRADLRRKVLIEKTKEALVGRGGADLRGACDAISQGMLLVDEHLTVRYANGAAATLLQAKRELLVGGQALEFIRHEQLAAALKEAASGTSRKRLTLEVEQQTDEGRGVLRYHVRPVRREDAASAMVLIEDITQQRVADESRNQFVAQATHELRTPLTNIRLYVETALDEGEKDAALRAKCLNVINSETARLERIVDDLLKVSEIESGSLKLHHDDVHLDEVLSQLLHDYEAQAQQKGIALAFNLPPKLPVINADRDKLTLAMHNLVGNALIYHGPRPPRVHVSARREGQAWSVAVRDEGIGIDPRHHELIFELFRRLHTPQEYPGTGLGLAICRRVIQRHGGRVWVESEPGRGATFRFTLPDREPPA